MSDTAADIVEAAEADPIDPDRLESLCDAASHDERVEAIRSFGRSVQKRLFEATAGREVTIDHIVPPETPPMQQVIHEGQNTLPAFRAFQKRFCRPDAEEGEHANELWGYNEQTFQVVTGPGYFVAYDDEETGEVCVDYRRIPPRAPSEWPELKPNEVRLGRFVYAGTVDRLRRTSEHMTIGRAFIDDDDPMNAWFVLVRAD